MSEYAICSNLQCDYSFEVIVDFRNGIHASPPSHCPRCGQKVVQCCQRCHCGIFTPDPDGAFTICDFCKLSLRVPTDIDKGEDSHPDPYASAESTAGIPRAERIALGVDELYDSFASEIKYLSEWWKIQPEELIAACAGTRGQADTPTDHQTKFAANQNPHEPLTSELPHGRGH